MEPNDTAKPRPRQVEMWIAIDPGQSHSGMVSIRDPRGGDRFVEQAVADADNNDALKWIRQNAKVLRPEVILIEDMAATGVPCGHALLDTARWIGRFDNAAQMAVAEYGGKVVLLARHKVRTLMGVRDDSGARQAVLEMFKRTGGGKTPQVGTVKQPGPLYDVTGHSWQAVALAMAHVVSITMKTAEACRMKLEWVEEVTDDDNPFNSAGQGALHKEQA